MAPPDLRAIERGRVKYIYKGTHLDEEVILKLIKDGDINTLKNPVKRVDKSSHRKVRNGFKERGSGERRQKGVHKR